MTRKTIYGFIAAEKTTYPVRLLCRALQVSASAFYDWLRRGSPAFGADELADAHAANELYDAWTPHRRTYGARRLTAEIHDRGQAWNRTKVPITYGANWSSTPWAWPGRIRRIVDAPTRWPSLSSSPWRRM